MNPKNIIIASSVVVVVATGAYLGLNQMSKTNTPEGRLLQNYEQLAKKVTSNQTKNALSGSCDNPQAFSKIISDLELELSVLKAKRVGLASQPEKANDGSKPLELSDGDYSQPNPKPGSQPLELSDGDYSKPGSKPLDLSDGKYDIDSSIMGKMYGLEEQIKATLNNLKSICEKKDEAPQQKEVISDSCDSACKKYSDCAGFTEDATKQDQQDAYDSCMEECKSWSKETVICINKKSIKNPADCGYLSQCALKEYGGMGNEMLNNIVIETDASTSNSKQNIV